MSILKTLANKKVLFGLVAALTLADAVAPAMAQPWGWGPPPPPGWGPRHHRDWAPPPRWRRHCWVETRRVLVDTPWGPRWRYRDVRICR